MLYHPKLIVEDGGGCYCIAFDTAEATRKRNTCLCFAKRKLTFHELSSRRLPLMHTHAVNTVIETCGVNTNDPTDRTNRHHKTIILASGAISLSRCHDAHLSVQYDPFVYDTFHADLHGYGVDGVEGVVVKDVLDRCDLCLSDI